MPEEINFYLKDSDYGFLSNFYPSPFIHDGIRYQTVEHFYQCHKTTNLIIRNWIRQAPKPYLAMKAGRSLRENDGFIRNWEEIKLMVMEEGLREKFGQNSHLREWLLDTGDAILHESSPSDLFWGKNGADMLGKLLMKIRGEIDEMETVERCSKRLEE